MSNIKRFSSRKEVTEFLATKGIDTSNWSEVKWLKINKGQSEIHMMALAESIWDAVDESTPKQLQPGEWHLPMLPKEAENLSIQEQLKWCVGINANTSYTVIGDGKKLTLEHATKIYDKCLKEYHDSVFEHCAKTMTNEEYKSFIKGPIDTIYNEETDIEELNYVPQSAEGWCYNLKGFISLRYIIDQERMQGNKKYRR